MAMKITFANGTQYPYLKAVEAPEYYDNATRRVLEVYMPAHAASLDALSALLAEESNLMTLTLTNDDDAQNVRTTVFENYGIKMLIALRPEPTGTDEATGETLLEEQVVLRFGRYTPVELRLRALGVA